jgi:hypothetical protein
MDALEEKQYVAKPWLSTSSKASKPRTTNHTKPSNKSNRAQSEPQKQPPASVNAKSTQNKNNNSVESPTESAVSASIVEPKPPLSIKRLSIGYRTPRHKKHKEYSRDRFEPESSTGLHDEIGSDKEERASWDGHLDSKDEPYELTTEKTRQVSYIIMRMCSNAPCR